MGHDEVEDQPRDVHERGHGRSRRSGTTARCPLPIPAAPSAGRGRAGAGSDKWQCELMPTKPRIAPRPGPASGSQRITSQQRATFASPRLMARVMSKVAYEPASPPLLMTSGTNSTIAFPILPSKKPVAMVVNISPKNGTTSRPTSSPFSAAEFSGTVSSGPRSRRASAFRGCFRTHPGPGIRRE